jgi:hypothetical protein
MVSLNRRSRTIAILFMVNPRNRVSFHRQTFPNIDMRETGFLFTDKLFLTLICEKPGFFSPRKVLTSHRQNP